MEKESFLLAIHFDLLDLVSATEALVNATVGSCSFKETLQADSDNSICFGGRTGSSYFRRNDLPLPVIPRIRVWAMSRVCRLRK
jgi:hypothetical protein